MTPFPNLEPMLSALPPRASQRLRTLGLNADTLREPERVLRRLLGAPEPVSLVDLELEPEQWHGAYLVSAGTVGWSRETTCLGRIWINPALPLSLTGQSLPASPQTFQARVSGVLLADAQVRAAHRARHYSPGGYGHYGLFVAELVAVTITPA